MEVNKMARGKYKMYKQTVYTDRYDQVCDCSATGPFRTKVLSTYGGQPIKTAIRGLLKMYAREFQKLSKKRGEL